MNLDPELLSKDARYLSPALARVFGVVATKGAGPYLYTDTGQRYLDMTSGIAVNQLGHCHPEVTTAAKQQLDTLVHVSCVTHHPSNVLLAEKLASILPGDMEQSFLCNSGAEAVDGALKLARYARPGRPNVISYRGSFHGRTIGAVSVSGSKLSMRRGYDPLLAGVHMVDYPNCWSCPVYRSPDSCHLECLDLIERAFRTNLPPESVSAIIIEPVLGEGGYVPAPNHRHNYLARLRELCDRHDILLIADEVQSGVGRTGKWFAVEQYGVVPDVLIFAKGLANGLPIGGYAVRRYLSGVQPPGSHGSTFGGNPVACAAALKTLETIETERLLARVTELGERAMDMLRQRTTATVRGYGFMIGLELDSEDASQRVMQGMYQRGILILPAGKQGLRFIPPLNVPEDLFWYALDALCEEIES